MVQAAAGVLSGTVRARDDRLQRPRQDVGLALFATVEASSVRCKACSLQAAGKRRGSRIAGCAPSHALALTAPRFWPCGATQPSGVSAAATRSDAARGARAEQRKVKPDLSDVDAFAKAAGPSPRAALSDKYGWTLRGVASRLARYSGMQLASTPHSGVEPRKHHSRSYPLPSTATSRPPCQQPSMCEAGCIAGSTALACLTAHVRRQR